MWDLFFNKLWWKSYYFNIHFQIADNSWADHGQLPVPTQLLPSPFPQQGRKQGGKAHGWQQGGHLPITIPGKTGKPIYCLLKQNWIVAPGLGCRCGSPRAIHPFSVNSGALPRAGRTIPVQGAKACGAFTGGFCRDGSKSHICILVSQL